MKAPVALEIGEQYLKLLAVKPLGRLRHLSDCIVKPISGLTDEQITDTLSKTLRELKINPHPLFVSIPRNQVTVRNLHLPSQDKKEITQILELHIGRIVPYRKEETIYNHTFLGIDELNYARVLLAIVHKDILKRQLKIIETAGLYIESFYLSSYGVWQWILSSQKSEINPVDLYLLLDVDANFTDFIIFNRENLFFTRGITMEAKESFKEQELTKLIGEVRQSLVIFNSEETNKKPVKVFVSGAMAVQSLGKVIQKELDIPVISVPQSYPAAVLKPQNTDIPSNVSLTALSDLVIGPGSRKIFFVLPEIQIRRSLHEKTREITVLGSIIIYLFAITVVFFWGKFYNQQVYLAKLNQQIKTIKQDIGDLLVQHKKIEIIQDFLNRRRIPLLVISELQKIVPLEIVVVSLGIDDQDKVSLKGQANQLSDVIRFTTSLENAQYFKNVSTKSTRTRKLKDRLVTDFEVSFELFNKTVNPQEKEAKPRNLKTKK